MHTASSPVLDLAKGRVIPLRDGDATYILSCRRIRPDDWKRYFASIVIKASTTAQGRVNEFDMESPFLLLAELVLEHATGYKVKDGAELESLPSWKQKIPIHHRVALGRVLAGARGSKKIAELVIGAESEEVYLDAPWSANHEGKLASFTGLLHVLRAPSEQQFKRFSAESSRSTVVGGARNGATLYRSVTPLLVELYDELVISVDPSYHCDGSPLASREQIVREMDYSHKAMAVQELMQTQRVVTAVEGDAD